MAGADDRKAYQDLLLHRIGELSAGVANAQGEVMKLSQRVSVIETKAALYGLLAGGVGTAVLHWILK